jgi:hypothetical protein
MPGRNERLQAVIVRLMDSGKAIGRDNDGFLVLFPRWGDVKNAEVGDTFSFLPQTPENLRGGMRYVAHTPKLEHKAIVRVAPDLELAIEDETEDRTYFSGPPLAGPPRRWLALDPFHQNKTSAGLPDHHANNFDKDGNIIFPPRPCDMEKHRRALRTSNA